MVYVQFYEILYIDTEILEDSILALRELNDIQKKRLSSVTFDEFFRIFDNLDVIDVENFFVDYIHDNESIKSIFKIFFKNEYVCNNLDKKLPNSHMFNYHVSAYEQCFLIYSLIIQRNLEGIFEKRKQFFKYEQQLYFDEDSMIWGCAKKIYNLIELSTRLGQPIVINPRNIEQNLQKRTGEEEIIDKIQPYGYYIEANIDCYNEIKMSLNQVIETTTKDKHLERSTLSIMNYSFKTTDMYESLSENIWSSIQQLPYSTSQESNRAKIYNNFKHQIITILQGLVSVYAILYI